MSRYSIPVCTDEELLKELKKLGYDEVPPDVFEKMKDELSELILKEQEDLSSIVENEHDLSLSGYDCNGKTHQSSQYLPLTSNALDEQCTAQENYKKAKADLRVPRKTKKKLQKSSLHRLNDYDNGSVFEVESNKFRNADNEREIKNAHLSLEYSNINDDDSSSEFENSHDKRDKVNKSKLNDIYVSTNSKVNCNRTKDIRHSNISKKGSPKKNDFELNYSPTNDELRSGISIVKNKNKVSKENVSAKSREKIQEISDTLDTMNDTTLKSVNNAFKAFNLDENEASLNNYKCSDINLNSSNSEKRTIKRKVLRRRNGKSVITEELVEIPSIFDTSYPQTENLNSGKSFSNDDLSLKFNSPTESVATNLSPESSIKSSPSTLSLSSRSTSLRISHTKKKKNDPVAMYNYYKKFWDSFKPPGENARDRLRWAVRDKMLEYHI